MKPAYLLYGVFAYAVFGVALLWAIGFIAPLPLPLPSTVDHGPTAPALLAVIVDAALLGLFAVQHTVMARASFKAWLTRYLPAGAERSTFVLVASASLLLLFWQWRPIPALTWDTQGTAAGLLLVLYGAGWLVVVASTFMIDHFHLFGLRQSLDAAGGRPAHAPAFKTSWLYAWIRHPIMTGFLITFWAAPRLTAGHLLFAAAASGYILVGIWFEERDLLKAVPEYTDYRRHVGGIAPKLPSWLRRSSSSTA